MEKSTKAAWLRRAWAAAIVALMCVMALGLAACGGSSSSSAAQSGSTSGSASSASESSASASSASASSASASSSEASSASASASASSAAAGDVVTFTDSAGRKVEVPAKIDRVAVTGPVSQMCMLTFAPNKMVGLSNELSAAEMKYVGEEYGKLPVYGQIYGGKGDFNKEAVASADPQVILDIGEAKKSIVEDLDEIQAATGIPCVHVEATLGSYSEAYEMLGELPGEEARATELSDYCEQAYGSVKSAMENVPAEERVKVAYLLGDAGLNAIPKGSFQGQVVEMIADNVAEVENATGSGLGNEVSFEQIALWDPQMIIFAPGSVYGTAANDPSWSTLTAVKDGNYYEVPGEPYNWVHNPPSVNQILGMQWFARLCYPDQFDDNIADVVKNYYKTLYKYDLSDEECAALLKNAEPKE